MEFHRGILGLDKGQEWGTHLAKRMMETERKRPRQREAEGVSNSLAELPPLIHEVQLQTQKLAELEPNELWELTRKCHLFRSLDLSGWEGVSVLAFRSLGLAVGASLESVNLSRTDISNEMLEIFAARLFSLRTINLTSCHKVSNLGVRALAEYCKSTLTGVDLSNCTNLNDEAVAYLGGAIGFGSCCGLLQSLALADCKRMSDAALLVLAKGCPSLRFLNLSGCGKVTTRGIKHIARGCPKMAVLNLYHCGKVQDGALISLAKCCTGLVSLNIALVGRITDAGVSALSRGCPCLQALNLAGAKQVTERGVCSLAQHCPGLHTLNLTGCVEVGLGGLHGLINGIGEAYVREAKTFFGFIPRRSMIDRRIEESQKAIEGAAATVIQEYWHRYKKRRAEALRTEHAQEDKAAHKIQAAFYRYRKKMVWWKARRLKKRTRSSIEIQRVYRAYRVRLRVQVLREERLALLAKGSQATPIQAIFRGFVTRKNDKLVRELQHAAAVRLETVVRAWIAHKQCAAWGEMKRQRMRDTGICARRIQSFWRGCIGKQTGAMVKSQIARIKRARHRTAIKLQAAYRGHRGRGEWRGAHRTWKRESRAARMIQKVFRGSRVMGWKDVRMNKVAQHVFMRQELEFQERIDSGKERYQQLVREANRDSCSEEEDEVNANEQWEEVWEEGATHSYWWNALLRESSPVKPLAFEESLVGLRVWVTHLTPGGASGKGKITRFHRKKIKHRLEFDGGGREWMNLQTEQDSLLVWVNNAWVQLINHVEPAVAEARVRKELLSRRRRANQRLFNREARWEHVHDETNGTLRYHDPQTGEILVALEGADMWTMEQDDVGDIIFVHRETQEVVYDDPRFEEDSRKERARAKIKCLEETRFVKYFCDEMCERRDQYEQGLLGAKAKRMLLEALASGKRALKMGSAIATARSVFRERELQENAELQDAMLLLKHMNDLKEWAQKEIQDALLLKTRFMKSGQSSPQPTENYRMGTHSTTEIGYDEGHLNGTAYGGQGDEQYGAPYTVECSYDYAQDENTEWARQQKQQLLEDDGGDYDYEQQYYTGNDSTQQHAESQDWG